MTHPRLRLAALLLGGTVLLQAHDASEFTVLDAAGKPLPQAVLEVTGTSLKAPLKERTDAKGQCHLDLKPGTYQIRISHPACLTLARSIQVGVGQPHHTPFTLHPCGATVEVLEKGTVANLSLLDAPLNHLLGLADAANEDIVTPAELAARPYQRPGDLLETVPGLLISQHSGEGKANQYDLRGFNLTNRRAADIDYSYESQLKTESAPVADTHFHPVEPRNLRIGASWRF